MRRSFERWFPGVAAAICTVAFWPRREDEIWAKMAPALSEKLLDVVAISVGFMAAALSILLAAQHLPILVRLKKAEAFGSLLDYYGRAIAAGFVSLFVCLCAVGAKAVNNEMWTAGPFGAVWVFTNIFGQFAFFRVFYLFLRILRDEGTSGIPAGHPLPADG